MNIFVLSYSPTRAAEYQCNKHVVKMVLETAQLLCSPFETGEAPYRRTHYNHPCSVWARQSAGNYLWLVQHGKALSAEYTKRYNKQHKSSAIIDWCKDNMNDINFEGHNFTPFVQAMPEECKRENAVEAYRAYYKLHKANIAKWPDDQEPYWWKAC